MVSPTMPHPYLVIAAPGTYGGEGGLRRIMTEEGDAVELELAQLRHELDAALARVRVLEAGLAEYADPEWWAYVDEHDAAGWMFMRDRAEPWASARAALAGEA